MTLEQALKIYLFANAALTALVGDHIYPRFREEGDPLPAVTFFRVDRIRPHCMGSDPTFREVRLQIDCWAEKVLTHGTKIGVCNATDAVIAALSRFRGVMGGAGGVTIQDILCDSDRQLPFEPGPEAQQAKGCHRISIDFRVFCEEA